MVCEEAPEPRTYGTRTKQKQRFLAGIVTPAQPHYLYGLLDANMDPCLGGTPPILAIATSAGGYKACSPPRLHLKPPSMYMCGPLSRGDPLCTRHCYICSRPQGMLALLNMTGDPYVPKPPCAWSLFLGELHSYDPGETEVIGGRNGGCMQVWFLASTWYSLHRHCQSLQTVNLLNLCT